MRLQSNINKYLSVQMISKIMFDLNVNKEKIKQNEMIMKRLSRLVFSLNDLIKFPFFLSLSLSAMYTRK